MLFSVYEDKCKITCDINEHLPTLYSYGSQCTSIVECGVREPTSAYAFASSLVGKSGNSYTLIDPYKSTRIDDFLTECKAEGVNAEFWNVSDIKCTPIQTDLLFIDSWHVYGQLKRELALWNTYVNKFIILHDTTVDELQGESVRMHLPVAKQSLETGIPEHEIKKGLWPAVVEFLQEHREWDLKERFTNNNGLTVLYRK